MAVAHRIAFVVYGMWKSGMPYHESDEQENSYAAKRGALARRANKEVKAPTLGDVVGKFLSPQTPGRVTDR